MQRLISIILEEWRVIFHDKGVMLVLVFAPLIYATIYSLTYSTEVLRNVPIGVVDASHTSASRELVAAINLNPNTVVAYQCTDMEQAKQLLFERKIYGIAYIPERYEQSILSGEMAHVAIYLDASYMLAYRQVFKSIIDAVRAEAGQVEISNITLDAEALTQRIATAQSIEYKTHTLFNSYLGYGAFVMPPALILILQQTMLVGVGMIGGTRREKGSKSHSAPCRIVVGRAIAYGAIYALIALYLLSIHYPIFGYPENGRTADVALFVGLYIATCALAATAMASIFMRRETSLLVLLWCSIPLLMLSGISYPVQAMPEWIRIVGEVIPSTHGIRGFVRLQTMGATLGDVWIEVRSLLILGGVYFALAYMGLIRASRITSTK